MDHPPHSSWNPHAGWQRFLALFPIQLAFPWQGVLNIYDYTSLMGELKIGKETTITVLRENKPVELKITLGSRE